jgi:hypothetical protein
VTGVELLTLPAVAVNFAEVAPAAIVTFAGTLSGPELLKTTTAPPAGAGPVNVTLLAADAFPPTMELGDSVTAERVAGTTVAVADLLTPPYVAVTVTGVELDTPPAETLNLAVLAPAGTVTLAGAVSGPELLSVTVAPPEGATPFKVTELDEEELPATIVAGNSVTELTAVGITVTLLLLDTPP